MDRPSYGIITLLFVRASCILVRNGCIEAASMCVSCPSVLSSMGRPWRLSGALQTHKPRSLCPVRIHFNKPTCGSEARFILRFSECGFGSWFWRGWGLPDDHATHPHFLEARVDRARWTGGYFKRKQLHLTPEINFMFFAWQSTDYRS